MANEQDSWCKSVFGVDPVQAGSDLYDWGKEKYEKGKQFVQENVPPVVLDALEVVTNPVGTVAKAVTGKPKSPAPGGGGGSQSGSPAVAPGSISALSGSVGAGGRNNPADVMAVQAALGIAADGKCGQGTIGAIMAFQQSHGLPKADGRVDPGGATARALAGGGGGPSPSAPPAPPKEESFIDGVKGFAGDILDGAENLGDLRNAANPGFADPSDFSPDLIEEGAKFLGGVVAGVRSLGPAAAVALEGAVVVAGRVIPAIGVATGILTVAGILSGDHTDPQAIDDEGVNEGGAPIPGIDGDAGPATQPRPSPGQAIPEGPATERRPGQAIPEGPATERRPAPGETIPEGPATERRPAPGETIPEGPATERSPSGG